MEKSQFEYHKYFHRRLIESLRSLAMDYKIQITLLPSELLWATTRELIDEYDEYYQHRIHLLGEGLITKEQFTKLEELDALVDIIVKGQIWGLEDLKNSEEWERIRIFSREILVHMGEKIKKPVDITWDDIENNQLQ